MTRRVNNVRPFRTGEELVENQRPRHRLLKPSPLSLADSTAMDSNEAHTVERILLGMLWAGQNSFKEALGAVFPDYKLLEWKERNLIQEHYRHDKIVLRYKKHALSAAFNSTGLNPVQTANRSVQLMTKLMFDTNARFQAFSQVGQHPDAINKLDDDVKDHIKGVETKLTRDGDVVLTNIVFHDIAKLARELLQISILAHSIDESRNKNKVVVQKTSVIPVPGDENLSAAEKIQQLKTKITTTETFFEETPVAEDNTGVSWDMSAKPDDS